MDHSLAPPIKKRNTILQQFVTKIYFVNPIKEMENQITSKKKFDEFTGAETKNTRSTETDTEIENETIQSFHDINESKEKSRTIESIYYPSSISYSKIKTSQDDSEKLTASTDMINKFIASIDTIIIYTTSINSNQRETKPKLEQKSRQASSDDKILHSMSIRTIIFIILSILAAIGGTKFLIDKYKQSKHNSKNTFTVNSNKQDYSGSIHQSEKESGSGNPIREGKYFLGFNYHSSKYPQELYFELKNESGGLHYQGLLEPEKINSDVVEISVTNGKFNILIGRKQPENPTMFDIKACTTLTLGNVHKDVGSFQKLIIAKDNV